METSPCNLAASGAAERAQQGASRALILVALLAISVSAAAALADARLGIYGAAFVLGWAQLVGLWGRSLATVLAPLVKGPTRSMAARDTAIFGLAGAITSFNVGYGLGALGHLALPHHLMLMPVAGFALVALAMARELAIIQVPLPQLRRVSSSRWAMMFPSPVAAALWGLDIGLFVTTRVSLLGAWIIPVVSVGLGDPILGAGLFGTYWLGRFASTLVTPLLVRRHDAVELLAELDAKRSVFYLTYRIGLVWAAVVFVLMVAT